MRGKTNENLDAQTVGSVWCIDRVDKGWQRLTLCLVLIPWISE